MSILSAEQFGEFFEAVYGHPPFPWQIRLAHRAVSANSVEQGWPDALDLPTASGKTSCIDIAVFALACQAQRPPHERSAPRRIFFVVDRRVIVDDTYERAKTLQQALAGAESGILKEVRDSLYSVFRVGMPSEKEKNLRENKPLDVFKMRGGAYRDDRWTLSPLQPAVIVSTVDQFGSRLLFRGYGPSPAMAPVHAGLAGNDSLVILDEAHCANPFRQTMESVGLYRSWSEDDAGVPPTPFRTTILSATPPADVADVFSIDDDDRNHHVLSNRINCSKPASMVLAPDANNERGHDRWALRLADAAQSLVSDKRRRIAVMVNRVATAKAVRSNLSKKHDNVVLLTGRMRPIDYAAAIQGLQGLRTGEDRGDGSLQFVVATQTLEVGADLDFDGMVTECASFDALRQRFGRLNRAGRYDVDAEGVIMARRWQLNGKGREDPVYGESLALTWEFLTEQAEDDRIDFGVAGIEAMLPQSKAERDDIIGAMSAPMPDAPVMLPSHLDLLAQTSPRPVPSPDVSLFLHGPDLSTPDVQVCWRSDLPDGLRSDDGRRDAIRTLELCPPVSAECLPVSISNMRRWLLGNDALLDISDLGREDAARAEDGNRKRNNREVIRWRGRSQEGTGVMHAGNLHDLAPGDTLVIPSRQGGWSTLGNAPTDASRDTIDVADRANWEYRNTARLRVHENVLASWPEQYRVAGRKLLAATANNETDNDDEIVQALSEISDAPAIDGWRWLHKCAVELRTHRRNSPHPCGGSILSSTRQRLDDHGDGNTDGNTPTDEEDHYSATVRVSLDDHSKGVADWARFFADKAGLSEDIQHDVRLAGQLHDIGKADPRMQALFYGGSKWAAQASGVLLAKSEHLRLYGRGPRGRPGEYPRGARHELLSVRLAQSDGAVLDDAHDIDLVLHLIASHHGRCRPFAPVVVDPEPQTVNLEINGHRMQAVSNTGLESVDSGVSDRFWRLVRRYGWWGLAWLEAMVRVADHRRSIDEKRGNA